MDNEYSLELQNSLNFIKTKEIKAAFTYNNVAPNDDSDYNINNHENQYFDFNMYKTSSGKYI